MATPAAGPKQPNLVSVTTINRDGSRFFLHPADSKGRFLAARRICALVLLALYILLPWIPVNGHPALFLDVAAGRYHVLGATFLTQDLWLLFFVLSGFGFGLIYATALFGRLWCGWACPYTVFLEHVFRRIERWIEGDAAARKRLDAAPWGPAKLAKRAFKHVLFFVCCLAVAHIFLAYFVSFPRLYGYVREAPARHLVAFGVVAGLTGLLYFCFAWFREQFCIILCPYGRLQSALTDDDTIVIGYDTRRGEPRGHKKGTPHGDCVDCRRCVQVCPTGIDIRNGLQLECIGCAACIDACDEIMAKVGRPRGLVRYDSLNGLEGRRHRYLRPRTVVYALLLLAGAAVLAAFLGRLRPVHVEVTRMTGMPYFVTDEVVRNQFSIRYLTKRNEPTTFRVAVEAAPAGLRWTGRDEPIVVPGQGERQIPLVVTIDRARYTGPIPLVFHVTATPGDTTVVEKVEFLGPNPKLLDPPKAAAAGTPPPGGTP